jgi:hypothetical protein
MIFQRPQTARKRRGNGYALLVVVFLVTLMLLAAIAVAPNILTEGKREQEKEMIWRGKQYVRGVKLHFRKYGRFPTSLDDLMKPKIGSLRFMRQPYKDPMNKEDGAWRLIYVGPNGQIIGSLKSHTINLQITPGSGPSIIAASQLASASGSPQPGANGLLGPGAVTQPGGAAPGSNPTSATGAPVGTDQSDSGSSDQAPPLPDASTIFGGNIIGVGSKIDRASVIYYDKAKNYRLFEFIWDPSKDALGLGQPGMQTGTGLGQIPGQNPLGQMPGQMPANPPQNPQQ